MAGFNAHVFLCDDVRREMGNKLSYMGVYGPVLAFPEQSHTFAKLCVAALVTPANPSSEVKKMGLRVELVKVGGERTLIQDTGIQSASATTEDVNAIEAAAKLGIPRPATLAVAILELRNLVVDELCQLSVKVTTNLGETECLPSFIIPASSREGAASRKLRKSGKRKAS